MKKTIKIGNAQGFWGDQRNAPLTLARQQADLDYLTLDYLSEVSLSILAIQKAKDPKSGYAHDFIDVVRSLVPLWKKGSRFKIIANAGGLNPLECALACATILKEENCSLKLAIISGDSVLSVMQKDIHNPLFKNLDSGESLEKIAKHLITANAYFGAKPIAEALENGANIVITGRLADPSLTVGPCVAEFGWKWNDFDRLAAATIAGHLLECGTQVTGGISTHWLEIKEPASMGFPVVEMDEIGDFIITKPENSGGQVTLETIKEQLLYEIGDPDNYLSPDVTASLLSLHLKDEDINRIKINGAKGKAPSPYYKVSATYQEGYKLEAFLAFFGKDIIEKALRCGDIIKERVKKSGFELKRFYVECLGKGDVVPGLLATSPHLIECVLRIAAADPRREALECLANQIAPLVTSGPQGVTGYTSGRPPVRQLFGYWPCLIPCSFVSPVIEYISV